MITIKEKDLDSFFEVPFNIYKDNHFVSLFKDDIRRFLSHQNPLFKSGENFTYFTAIKDGVAVGRIVALYHQDSNQRHQLQWGYFGYFDCEDSIETAQLLIDKATAWIKDRGLNEIVGNINFTFMQQIGVMTEGFENFPYSDQVYTPSYLKDILYTLGFESFFPMVTSEAQLDQIDLAVFEKDKIKEIENNSDFTFKEVGYFGIKKAVFDATAVLNEGFANNPFFTPITTEDFHFQAKDLMLVLDPGLTVIAYHQNRPIGITICIPDINPLLHEVKSQMGLIFLFKFLKFKLKRKRAVIIFYSVSPDFHGKGVNQAILKRVITNLKKKGYQSLGITWIADINKSSLRQMEIIKAKPLHKLCLFKKAI